MLIQINLRAGRHINLESTYRTRLSWKHHDFAHEKLRVRSVSRMRPNLVFRLSGGNFLVAGHATSCLAHNH